MSSRVINYFYYPIEVFLILQAFSFKNLFCNQSKVVHVRCTFNIKYIIEHFHCSVDGVEMLQKKGWEGHGIKYRCLLGSTKKSE